MAANLCAQDACVDALTQKIALQMDAGEWESALANLEIALLKDCVQKNISMKLDMLYNRFYCEAELSREPAQIKELAQKLLRECLAISKEEWTEAEICRQIVPFFVNAYELDEAEKYALQAIKIYERGGKMGEKTKISAAKVYSNLGYIAWLRNQPKENEAYLLRAQQLLSQTEKIDSMASADVLGNLAIFYGSYGNNKQAERTHLEAIALASDYSRNASLRVLWLAENASLGDLYLKTAQLDKAKSLLNRLLSAREKFSTPQEQSDILYFAQSFYAVTKNWAQAEAYTQEYEEFTRANYPKNSYNVLDVLQRKASLLQEMGKIEAALQLGLEIKTQVMEVFGEESEEYLNAIRLLSLLQQEMGNLDLFDKLNKEAMRLNAKPIGAADADRIDYLKGEVMSFRVVQRLFEDYCKILALRYAQSGDAKFMQEQYDFAKATLDLARRYRNRTDDHLDRIGHVKLQHILLGEMIEASTLDAKGIDMPALFRLFEESKAPTALEQRFRGKSTVITMQQLQDKLQSGQLFIAYFSAQEALYVFAANRERAGFYALPIKRDSLSRLCKRLQGSLIDFEGIHKQPDSAYAAYTTSAHSLYKQLVAPIVADFSDATRLIILPDGDLSLLPFSALLTAPAPESYKEASYNNLPYLLQKYAVSYHYSATLLLDDFVQEQRLMGLPLRMLAMSADYMRRDSLSGERTPNYQQLRRVLSPLPATHSEVAYLSQVFEGEFIKGEGATEANFYQKADKFTLLHLAMHGLADFNDYRLSQLVFTEDGDSIQNNFLDGGEIEAIKLNALHIVLSACETAAGETSDGEGSLSLARAFAAAGNPSLLVSLWQVNDQITSQFMQIYYQALLRGEPKDLALQNTQREYLRLSKGIAAHPAYWSPFVQFGSTSALPVASNSSKIWTTGAIVALIAAIAGGSFWWIRKRRAA